MKPTNIIEIKISIYYGSQYILKEIELVCREKEFVAIVGKSGTGKSSLLNAIAGFIPYEGEVTVPDHIGYVFQNYVLFPWTKLGNNQ